MLGPGAASVKRLFILVDSKYPELSKQLAMSVIRVVVRQLGGDDTGQGEILSLRPNTVLRVTVYRYE
jgi:hypothetical protein